MALIFILRSDGINQRYNVSRKNMKKYQYTVSSFKYHGIKRSRRVYSHEIKVEKPSEKPHFTEKKSYKNVIKASTDTPIPNEVGQVHIKLWTRKGSHIAITDGFSHRLLLPDQYQRAYNQALNHCLAQLPFSPDEMKILKVDFQYVIPKGA